MRSDSLGEAAARENSSPPRRDHLFVIVDARRACLNPDSIRNSSPHRIRRCNAGVARAESQKEVARDDAEVPSSGMQGDADSPRFFPSPSTPPFRAFTLLFTPFLSTSTPLSVFFHSEAYTRPLSLSLSILRFLSRDAAAAFRAFLSFPFRVFPAPLFPLLFSSREFLTRPFRAPLIPVSFEPEMESSWFIPSFRIPLFIIPHVSSPLELPLINDFRPSL